MIMSANRGQPTGSAPRANYNTSSLRKWRPPSQPAPKASVPQESSLRSHTLNRLEMLRARQQNQCMEAEQQRWSSLSRKPVSRPQANSFQRSSEQQQEIYAPASIASPNEFVYKRAPVLESQHYAATSCRGNDSPAPASGDHSPAQSHRQRVPSSSETRTGRESALGSLWSRFGTLRRKSRLLSLRRSSSSAGRDTPAPSLALGGAPPKVTVLDPEVYGTGKKEVQAEEIYAEGLVAIDGNRQRRLPEFELDQELMGERERRVLIEEGSKRQEDYKLLVRNLTNWINDELAEQRIIVGDLQEDLYDGQILSRLLERLHRTRLDLVEVTQNESLQRAKLETLLSLVNRLLFKPQSQRLSGGEGPRWTVEGIHSKNMVEIIYLLVALAKHFRAPIKIPANVSVQILVVEKRQNQLIRRSQLVQLTGGELGGAAEPSRGPSGRDVFDTLVEYAPEKLEIVKQSLVKFANNHLNKVNMAFLRNKVSERLDPEQFADGLLLVFLIASLEGYFVPLGNLFTSAPSSAEIYSEPLEEKAIGLPDLNNNANIVETALEPTSYVNTQPIQRLHNVNFALQLMEEAGLPVRERVRPEDIVNGDLKALMRLLYALFSRYKHL